MGTAISLCSGDRMINISKKSSGVMLRRFQHFLRGGEVAKGQSALLPGLINLFFGVFGEPRLKRLCYLLTMLHPIAHMFHARFQ